MSLFRKLVGIFQAAGVALRKRLLGGLPPVFVEDVFSTWLYTTTNTNLTITNGINLSLYGGMTWFKPRTDAVLDNHIIVDTARSLVGGARPYLITNSSAAQSDSEAPFYPGSGYDWTSTGFVLGQTEYANGNKQGFNSGGGVNMTSWTFRKQAKFFDIVTYTGNGSAPRNIAHNLGSVPGCIMIKRTDTTSTWTVYHSGIGNTKALFLNADSPTDTNSAYWNNTTPTSTVFTLGGTFSDINASGGTYVAYLFAHNAGGFGLTGSDNVISCGSFTSNASGGVAAQNLGYEPQFIIWKSSSSVDSWRLLDNTRGMWVGTPYSASPTLFPDLSSAESNNEYFNVSGTGFSMPDGSVGNSVTFVYIAIRRGPMKVPTVGTSVFVPITRTGTATTAVVTGASFPPDLAITKSRDNSSETGATWYDRLRGTTNPLLISTSASAQQGGTNPVTSFNMNGVTLNDSQGWGVNLNTVTYINYFFQRAPSFFDEVCYTGTGSGTQTISHNLGVTPELTINKSRSGSRGWTVYYNNTTFLRLNQTTAGEAETLLSPTATTFNADLGAGFGMNAAETYVTYLFATCPGVSKVGSYTGTATTKQIDCGFTAGARFVLIKRTDSTGNWHVWDTARGIISGNDAYSLLNDAVAEVTNTDYIDPYSAGFELSSTAPAAINANGGTYIFLAIA